MTNEFSSTASRRILPVVMDMCERINGVFVNYVGPIAHEIAEEIFEHWRAAGNTGPSGVSHYIHLLSENIFDEKQRTQFREEAANAMRDALQRRS